MSEFCSICGASLASAAALVEHMKTDHPNPGPDVRNDLNPEAHTPGLVCTLCGQRFPNAAALARHNLGPHRDAESTPRPHPTSA
jgi:hypothetical protein